MAQQSTFCRACTKTDKR